ncbi:MAG: ABC transporter permease [Acidobacteriaceae bacterium]|nr:ABC transporter permease [Acidobacteriaceae bacterium]
MMRLVRRVQLRLRSLFFRSNLEDELKDELSDYVQHETERQVASGASPEEARRMALVSLGGVQRVKEECRDARGVRWVETSVNDVRFAFRTLAKTPGLTIIIVGALAFCIGLNAAMFSVVDTVLFRPLPLPDQDRLVSVTEGAPALGFPVMPFAAPDYWFVSANSRSFASTGVYRNREYEIAGAGEPRRIDGARVSASLFEVLEVRPAAGRAFTQYEDEHSARLVVLSNGLAQGLFGTSEKALGRTLLLDRIPYQVIGVMPASFSFPIRGSRFNDDPAQLFVPVSWDSEDRKQTVSDFDYSMMARLRPNVTVQQADAEVRALIRRLVENYPTAIKQMLQHLPKFSLESEVIPFREEFTGNVERPLILLLASVGVLLLIGCSDVANLMFTRMGARRREFAVRSALGAGFWRLTQQTLTEGLILSTAGGALGLCIARWTLPVLIHFAPETLPRANEIGLNWRMAAFVAAVTLLTPIMFCVVPFVNTLRTAATTQLHGEGRTTTQSRRERLTMSGAVVLQFSLAFVLLTTAGLLLRSFVNAKETNPGFEPEHVISMRITLPNSTYKTPAQITSLFNRLLTQLTVLPGFRQSGAISDLPMGSSSNVILTADGAGRHTERADYLFCLGSSLRILGVHLLQGRLFAPDDYLGKTHSAVITEGMAKRLWPGQNPIGRHIKFGVDDPMNDQPWLTVIGVVADVKATLTSRSPRVLVFTTPPDWINAMEIIVRTSGNPLSIAKELRQQIARIDPNLAAGRIETVDEILGESLSAERFRTWLLTCFAVVAILLATLGIGGLLAYNAAQRRQEFGVRIALGAQQWDLLGLVVRDCLRLSAVGVVIGLAASLAVARTISGLLYDTSPFDPGTFASVSFTLILFALGASIFPIWRVMHINPVVSLRTE